MTAKGGRGAALPKGYRIVRSGKVRAGDRYWTFNGTRYLWEAPVSAEYAAEGWDIASNIVARKVSRRHPRRRSGKGTR